MLFTRWLANHLRLSPRPASRRQAPAARPRFRPMLEALEERWVPSTLTVTSAADSGTGSLRAEINAAQSGDTIVFAPKLDGQTITLTKGELLINKNLTINGPGAGQLTVSGNHGSRVFEVAQGIQATLSDLTISNGYAVNGAGILVDSGAGLALSNSTLSGNSATKSQKYVANFGGGIDNYGTTTVSNCALTNNTSPSGGGIYNHATLTVNNNSVVSGSAGSGIGNSGMATISDSKLSDNGGGGIYNIYLGTVTVQDSLLSGNFAYGDGGGIWNLGKATLSNCTLSGNSAPEYGGAIYSGSNSSGSGSLNVSGCTLTGNSSTHNSGGAIYIANGTATIGNCTFSGNSAAVDGGAIYLWRGGGATLTMTGSTLSDNSAQYFGGGIYIVPGAVFDLDASTLANTLNNTDSSGLNGSTANLDGPYTLLP